MPMDGLPMEEEAMGLFVNQGLLVTASRMGGDIYPYNPALVVLATEFIKLIMVAFIYLKS